MSQYTNLERVTMIVLRAMRGPVFLLILVYALGIGVLVMIPGANGERMNFLHALYFLSYTATTTGFGELPTPFSNAQRIWAIGCLHLSVIAWLYSIGTIISLVQNQHFIRSLAQYRFGRSVQRLNEPFVIICGFGDSGSLLARSLDGQHRCAVVIDNDPDRIKALRLRNYRFSMPGVCADSTDPEQLLNAGVRHPCCQAVVAVTDDEYLNSKIAVLTRCLNPDVRAIARVSSRERAEELLAIGSIQVLDAFDIFADRLCMALRRPNLRTLGDWLAGVRGARLDQRIECPEGRWIICGYGRMGQHLEENLAEERVETVVIDPRLEHASDNEHIAGHANQQTLIQAGIRDASCLIAATDRDTINLRLLMQARLLNPELFLVVRQNHHANEAAFAGVHSDLLMQPDRVVARRILLELVSPALNILLDHLQQWPEERIDKLLQRLDATIGQQQAPQLWVVRICNRQAPAVAEHLNSPTTTPLPLGALLCDPRDRVKSLACVPLVLLRKDRALPLPDVKTDIELNDELIFCGTHSAHRWLDGNLHNQRTLEYVLTGDSPVANPLMRALLLR